MVFVRAFVFVALPMSKVQTAGVWLFEHLVNEAVRGGERGKTAPRERELVICMLNRDKGA